MIEELCTFIGAMVLIALILAGITALVLYLIFHNEILISRESSEDDTDNISNQ